MDRRRFLRVSIASGGLALLTGRTPQAKTHSGWRPIPGCSPGLRQDIVYRTGQVLQRLIGRQMTEKGFSSFRLFFITTYHEMGRTCFRVVGNCAATVDVKTVVLNAAPADFPLIMNYLCEVVARSRPVSEGE